jgi:RNA polymerase sigma-70 factor (ECF subfamily)
MRYESREAISLAFITALQMLPTQQRAVVVLRDVLDFPARDVATILDTTEQAVTSALKRARATLDKEQGGGRSAPPPINSPAEQELMDRLLRAFEDGDVDGMVALMTDDVWLRMPPLPFEYQGRDVAGRFFATVAFRDGRRYRLVPTRANGQPAFGAYLRDPVSGLARIFGLLVITVEGDRISAITRFENAVIARFGLPRILPDEI